MSKELPIKLMDSIEKHVEASSRTSILVGPPQSMVVKRPDIPDQLIQKQMRLCGVCKMEEKPKGKHVCQKCWTAIQKETSNPLGLALWAARTARACQASRMRKEAKLQPVAKINLDQYRDR